MKLIAPIEAAFDRMASLLFRPFEIKRWFLIGFTAWLASFLTGGNNAGFNFSRKWPANEKVSSLVASWGPEVWVSLILGILVVICVLVLVFFWLGCRGQFMLLDNVVKGTAEVRKPWREFRSLATSLLKFFIVLQAVWLLVILMVGGLTGFYYWTNPHGESWTHYILLGIVILLVLLISLVFAVIFFFVREFGVLWMYRNGGTAWEAAGKVRSLAAAHPWDFLLYLLVRIVMGVAIIILGTLAGCLTCCVGFLPYVNSVITLPLSVFRVCFAVEYFAQIGPDCDLRGRPPTLPPDPLAGLA